MNHSVEVPAGLRVRADLQLDLDGVEAVVVGNGTHLTVRTDDAAALLARLVATAPREQVRFDAARSGSARLAQALHDAGLTLDVVDDRGTVVEYGVGTGTLAAALILGAEHTRLGPAPVVAATLLTIARRDRTVQRVGAVMGLLLTAVAATRLVSRGRRPHPIGRTP